MHQLTYHQGDYFNITKLIFIFQNFKCYYCIIHDYRLTKPTTSDKANANNTAFDLSEVQDFSMSKPKSSVNPPASPSTTSAPFSSSKVKLDNVLTKLMKKNNCVSVHTCTPVYIIYYSFKFNANFILVY